MGEKGMKNREELQQEILEILRGRKSPKIMRAIWPQRWMRLP